MKVASLFAGIGGFDLAARWMGWRTVWYSEIEPYASAVMRKHFPDAINHGDITKINGSEVEPVDILCGGFPCQDISLAGKGAGLEGERSGLWFHYARLIGEMPRKPRYIVAENVSALRSRGLDKVLGSLAALGYDAEWHCIPASYVGAPHRRDRVWIIAYPASGGGRGIGGVLTDTGDEGRNTHHSRPAGIQPGDWRTCASEPDSVREAVAYPASDGRTQECPQRGRGSEGSSTEGAEWGGPVLSSPHVADSLCSGLEGHAGNGCAARREAASGSTAASCLCSGADAARWWASEPNVGRVAHGIPARVHRLRCLGNAIVPQVAHLIFQAIAHREARLTSGLSF